MERLGIPLQALACGWMDGVLMAGSVMALHKNGIEFISQDNMPLTPSECIAEIIAQRDVRLDRTRQRDITTPTSEACLLLNQVGIPLAFPFTLNN